MKLLQHNLMQARISPSLGVDQQSLLEQNFQQQSLLEQNLKQQVRNGPKISYIMYILINNTLRMLRIVQMFDFSGYFRLAI